MNSLKIKSEYNIKLIKTNPYPGRGIIMGMTPDSKMLAQVYWIMGRSNNSRNRIFREEEGFVRTEAWEPSKVEDPSLIIYFPVKHHNRVHIVSNGDQTDTIYEAVKCSETFEAALSARTFEPDAPNYTPRISGLMDLEDKKYSYKLSIIKSIDNNPDFCQRQFFYYEEGIPGYGHCLHTYSTDGDPIPSFDREPFLVPIFSDIQETADFYWNTLNYDNKISLLVKYINIETNDFRTVIINKNK